MRKIHLFIIFAIAITQIHSLVFAQPSSGIKISGYVFDARDQQPINHVNVFLNNTMLGDATDKNGYFEIKNVQLGNYQLVVSHIGYLPEQKKISITTLQNHYYEFKIAPKIFVAPELTVSVPEAKEWRKNLEKFKIHFLGGSENAKQCRIINPEVLSFKVDESANKFAATAEDLIIIENNALGYRIHFLLDVFAKYDENIVYFGKVRFELLEPKNLEELKKWQETRLRVYKGSLRHFLQAFVSKKLHNEGFLVLKTQSIYDSKTFNLVPDSETGEFILPGLLPFEKELAFDGFLKVYYTGNPEKLDYFYNRRYRFLPPDEKKRVESETSWISLNQPSVKIDTTGYVFTTLDLTRYGRWSKDRVAEMLPYEYSPNSKLLSIPLAKEEALDVSCLDSLFSKKKKDLYVSFLRKADSLFRLEKYNEAEMAYRQALLFNKHSLSTLKGLGKIAYVQKEWGQFNKWFDDVLKINPQDSEAMDYRYNKSVVQLKVNEADSLLAIGDCKGARKAYKKALDLDDKFVAAIKGLAKIAYEKNRWDIFQKWLTHVLTISPTDLEAIELLNNNPKIRSILSKANSLSQTGEIEAAEKTFKEALELNEYSIPALKWLGLNAFNKKDWTNTKNWLGKMSEKQPEDLETNYCLSIAYRETGKYKVLMFNKKDFKNSEKHFDFVIQNTDSAYKDVLYQRALLERFKDSLHIAIKWGHYQIALKPELIHAHTGLFKLYRSFIRKNNSRAVLSFLRNQPSDLPVYFQGEFFRINGNLSEAEKTFVALLQRDLDMSRKPVLLSLIKLSLQQKQASKANEYFKQAFTTIDSHLEAEFLFEQIKYIFKDQELDIFKTLSIPEHKENFFRTFWGYRDPTPDSPINYRALQHFRRLVYAEENYWYDDLRSWVDDPDFTNELIFPKIYRLNEEFNDKGLVYIRHGEPDSRATTLGATTPDPSRIPDQFDVSLQSNESWLYYERQSRPKLVFHFLIGSTGIRNNWRLAPLPFVLDYQLPEDRLKVLGSRVGWDKNLDRLFVLINSSRSADSPQDIPRVVNQGEYSSVVNQVTDESRETVYTAMSTDSHTWDKDAKELNVVYRLAYLRGFKDKTRMVVYFGIPLEEIEKNSPNETTESDLEYGLGVYDIYWHQEVSNFEVVDLESSGQKNITKNLYINGHVYELKPDKYNFSLYAKASNSLRIGGDKIKIDVPGFNTDALAMSDLILAYEITEANSNGMLNFERASIIPNPTNQFSKIEPVQLYYEIYNLSQNKSGETSYTIDYELTQLKRKRSGLKKLFGGGSKKSISISEEKTGSQATGLETANFDISKLQKGDYELQVKVKDGHSKQTVKKVINLIIQ